MGHPSYDVVPANGASWEHLVEVFGVRGPAARCWCQRYKLARGEAFVSCPQEDLADRLRDQTDAGHPGSERTSGLVAYAEGEPVGWCAVEPRTAYRGLVRNAGMAAWTGRDEDRADPGVWAVTCVLVRGGPPTAWGQQCAGARRGQARPDCRGTGARGIPADHRLGDQRGAAPRGAEHLLGRGVPRGTPALGSPGSRGDRALIDCAGGVGIWAWLLVPRRRLDV